MPIFITLFISSIAILLCYFFPILLQGPITAFSTVTGFLTIYGVVYAIYETYRARTASQMANDAASEAKIQILKLLNVKDISECQILIRTMLGDLERNQTISLTSISRITELYVVEFNEYYNIEDSIHRKNLALLKSFDFFGQNGQKMNTIKRKDCKKLTSILLDMQSQLSVSSNEKLSG